MSHKPKCLINGRGVQPGQKLICLTDSDGTEHYYVEDQEPGDDW